MNHAQMKERCPSGKFVERACLEKHKFVYDGFSKKRDGSVANIVESDGTEVWGGLFEINEDNLATLDCHEGYPESYSREVFLVRNDKNETREAVSYFRTGKAIGEPGDQYRSVVLQGAQDCKLSKEYIQAAI